MRQLITLSFWICCILPAMTYGQTSNVIFFTDDGMRFHVFINGQNQNLAPQTNVKIEQIPATTYKAKIVFEKSDIPVIEKNLF